MRALRCVMATSGAPCDAPHHADSCEFNIDGCLGGKKNGDRFRERICHASNQETRGRPHFIAHPRSDREYVTQFVKPWT
jgi:hypothetical protein